MQRVWVRKLWQSILPAIECAGYSYRGWGRGRAPTTGRDAELAGTGHDVCKLDTAEDGAGVVHSRRGVLSIVDGQLSGRTVGSLI